MRIDAASRLIFIGRRSTPFGYLSLHRPSSISPRLSLASVGRLLVIVVLAVCGSRAWAGSGFALRSQSTTTLGTAQAGMTAAAEDVSTIIFNPAALGFGSRLEFATGGTWIGSHTQFQEPISSTALGTPIAGGDGGNAGRQAILPNMYVGADLAQGCRIGLAVTSLFGLGASWDDGWVGRYYADSSTLATLDIVPTVSYRIDQALTVGVAADIKYARGKTSTALDFGTLDVLLLSGAGGGVPSNNDGGIQTDNSGWGVGYNLGAIYQLGEGTRLGASYHSRVHATLKGPATFTSGGVVGQTVQTLTGAFVDTASRSSLTFPAYATAGVYHELDGQWAVMADVQWTQWSLLRELKLQFDNPAQPPAVTELDWRDSWFFAVGARYTPNDTWKLRIGVAYDQTPTRSPTNTPAIPEANSVWLAIGSEYRISPDMKLDFAYGHIFVKDQPIALTASMTGNLLRGNLQGTIGNSSVDFASLQFSMRF